MALILVAIATAVVIFTIAAIRRYPFEIFAFLTRRALAKAGLQKKSLDGLTYWSGGQAISPVLVFVHGVNDQAGTWAPVIGKFANRFRIIIPDLPGHGESAPLSGPLGMQQIVDGLTKIIAAETGDEPIHLVGNSMGGWVSLIYAIRHPEKVKRLVLEDSSGMTWNLTGVPLVPENREQAARGMRAVLGPKAQLPANYVLDAMVRRAPTAPMIRMIQSNVAPFAVDSQLSSIHLPVTMIWGDSDGVLPLRYAEMLQSRIPAAKLHVIADCGHIPHRQKPERFASLLDEAIHV